MTNAQNRAEYSDYNDHYKVISASYDQLVLTCEADIRDRKLFRELVLRYAEKDQILLDFGGGTGLDAVYFASLGYNVLLHDSSKSMCDISRKKVIDAGLTERVGISCGDLDELKKNIKARSGKFTIVSNFCAINHLENPDAYLRYFCNIVGEHGKVIFCAGNIYFYENILTQFNITRLIKYMWASHAEGYRGEVPYLYLGRRYFNKAMGEKLLTYSTLGSSRCKYQVSDSYFKRFLKKMLSKFRMFGASFRFYVYE